MVSLRFLFACFVSCAVYLSAFSASTTPHVYNIRDHGATGDGRTIDSPAINAAIEAASASGGGTVYFPAGTYASYSLRLRGNLTLQFAPGAVLLAAEPPPEGTPGGYDHAEPNEWGDTHKYQDFGHSHWHNSLIWGENLENISIVGPGLIDGRALSRGEGAMQGKLRDGMGNKAIALKLCRNVTLRDLTLREAGHFALLATGVDHLTLDNLKVDTNRDGFDLDGCRHVRIANCSVNTPNDDAIVLKSSYALGALRSTEDITITNCAVSGFDLGTMLDGSHGRTMTRAPDRDGPTGRIKIGTESNGDFRAITISNCTFERSRGLALESVDGGIIEDVVVTNLTMREITTSPIFIRLGNRARGPEGTQVGKIRRVKISHVTVQAADARYPVLIVGLPGHPLEDITLSDLHLVSRGGMTLGQVGRQSAELVNPFFLRGKEAGVTGPRDPFTVPERAAAYPEPSMFGLLPASGFYLRHVTHFTARDVTLRFVAEDKRPVVVIEDGSDISFENLKSPRPAAGAFVLRNVHHLDLNRIPHLPDGVRDEIKDGVL